MNKLLSKIFITLFFFISTSIISRGANFIVTSNADAGVGTLREAIQNSSANGSAVTDYIFFNLPGTTSSDFTINLITQLPDIPSGLIIDGSSQTGGFNFTQQTKVKISSPNNSIPFTIFKGTNVVNFQFYGLYLYDFADEVISRPNLGARIMVDLKNSKNIIIGESGKGNLVRGGNIYNMVFESCQEISLKGNLFGWDTSESFTNHNPGLHFNNCNEIYIGGDITAEKNTFFLSIFFNLDKTTSITNAQVKGNNFGVLENENSPLWYIQGHANFIYVRNTSGLENVIPTVNLKAVNNVFWNQGISVYINRVLGEQEIIGNYFGITKALVPMVKNGGSGTFIYSESTKGKLRVLDNYINVAYRGIVAFLSEDVHISNNKYTCIVDPVYLNEAPKKVLTQLTVGGFEISNNLYRIKGISDPNAIVEVYDSDKCYSPVCKPRYRIGVVTADASGNWEFTSSTNPITYFFSATSKAQSSEFKSFNITENINIENAKCNELGKLTGLEPYLTLNPKVKNSLGKEIPVSELNALPAGKYTISVDGACAESTFEIRLITPLPFGQVQVTIMDNSCGLNNGKISINSFNGKIPATYQWRNVEGKTVSEAKDLTNQPSGFYALYGKDENNCEQYIGSYEIKTILELTLLKNDLVITEDVCGSSSGSISNLKTSGGVEPLTYQWLNEEGKEIGTTLNVSNLKAGIYHLIIKDKYCSNFYKDFEVLLAGKILEQIKQDNVFVCGPGDFFLQSNIVQNARIYNLYNENGDLLQQNKDGTFNISISKPQKLMLSYFSNDCESLPTSFDIIFKQPEIKVPSAFSPNSDGVNDTWTINDISKYPSSSVSIYNRLGGLVYSGGQKNIPFDGRLNGKDLANGVYYYVIKLNPYCPTFSGSLTLIR